MPFAIRQNGKDRFHISGFGASVGGRDGCTPFTLSVRDRQDQELVRMENVVARELGLRRLGSDYAANVYRRTDVFTLKNGVLKSSLPAIQVRLSSRTPPDSKVPASPSWPPAPQGRATPLPSHAQAGKLVFDGLLRDYLDLIKAHLASPVRLVGWQRLINASLQSTPEQASWRVIRYGQIIGRVRVHACGGVYEIADCVVVATDNEATVSIYELTRTSDDPAALSLPSLFVTKKIHTGTIKPVGMTNAEKEQIVSSRVRHGLPAKAGGFPTSQKPHPAFKYSHIAMAKPGHTSGNDADRLRLLTARCISPINIVLTHTPERGNFRKLHSHALNGQSCGDLGERADLLKFFLAAIFDHLRETPLGLETLRDTIALTGLADELGMPELATSSDAQFTTRMNDLLVESARHRVCIEEA